MKQVTSTTIIIVLCAVIVNLGEVYALSITPTPGYIFIAAERNANNNRDTGFFKIGGAALTMHQYRKRIKLNSGNARHLVMKYFPVTHTRAAKSAAFNALRQWAVNLGGGRRWFYVTPDKRHAFLATFQRAIQKYRGNIQQIWQLYNNYQRRNTNPLQRNQHRNLYSPNYHRRGNRPYYRHRGSGNQAHYRRRGNRPYYHRRGNNY